MSQTIAFVALADLAADVTLTDTVMLETFWTNPEAVRLLVYGTRAIPNAATPHDHDQDGGESLLLPIVAHSFGQYVQNLVTRGIPIGPAVSGSFAESTTQGILDKSTAKRLFCIAAIIPGGVLGVRCSLVEYHESAALDTKLTITFRHLGSVNLKRGVAPEEASVDISYTTAGAAAITYHSAELADLSSLGDPTLDREVEVALWLTSDVSATEEQRILDLEVLPLFLTAGCRKKTPQDTSYPTLAVKEIKAGVGVVSGLIGTKMRSITNSLSVSTWGSSPGLLPRTMQPDRRRRYRETITACHQHQGSMTPAAGPTISGDGACLRDTQSLGYLTYLGETLPLVAATPPTMDSLPNQGQFLHKNVDTGANWIEYNVRRSIPAGCGALSIRVGVHAGYTFAARSYDTSSELWVRIRIGSVAGGGEITTRLFCGPNESPIDSRDPDYEYVKLEPEDDLAHVPNRKLFRQGLEAWSHGAEKTDAELGALQVNEVLYRVSKPIRVQLTYPPERPLENFHPTLDYNIKMRFQMRNSLGVFDIQAGCLWIVCSTAPDY